MKIILKDLYNISIIIYLQYIKLQLLCPSTYIFYMCCLNTGHLFLAMVDVCVGDVPNDVFVVMDEMMVMVVVVVVNVMVDVVVDVVMVDPIPTSYTLDGLFLLYGGSYDKQENVRSRLNIILS